MHSSDLCPALEQDSESPLWQYDSNSLPREPNEAHIDAGSTSQIQLQATPSAQQHLMEQGSRGQESGHCTGVSRGEAGTETEQGPLPCQGLHSSALLLAGQPPEVKALSLNPFSLTSILARHWTAAAQGGDVGTGPAPAAGESRSSLPSHGAPGAGAEACPPNMTSDAFQPAWQPPAHTNKRK